MASTAYLKTYTEAIQIVRELLVGGVRDRLGDVAETQYKIDGLLAAGAKGWESAAEMWDGRSLPQTAKDCLDVAEALRAEILDPALSLPKRVQGPDDG